MNVYFHGILPDSEADKWKFKVRKTHEQDFFFVFSLIQRYDILNISLLVNNSERFSLKQMKWTNKNLLKSC